jgi:hypothetical protein
MTAQRCDGCGANAPGIDPDGQPCRVCREGERLSAAAGSGRPCDVTEFDISEADERAAAYREAHGIGD